MMVISEEQESFEEKHQVRLLNKSQMWTMRLIGFFSKSFMERFWTTVRFPFCKGIIAYPSILSREEALSSRYHGVIEHELIHVNQQRTTWGLFKSVMLYFFFPLPFYFSGRWFIEREPYLKDIEAGRQTVDQAINILWYSYGWTWPKKRMKKWFESKLNF